MKTKKSGATKPSTLNSRLAAYSATAVAAMMSAPANAGLTNISSVSGTYSLSGPRTATFHIDPSGLNLQGEFSVTHQTVATSFHSGRYYHNGKAICLGMQFACSVHGNVGSGLFVAPKTFAKGAAVHGQFFPGAPWTATNRARFFYNRSSRQSGQFGNKTGYAVFKVNKNATTYYGWLKVKEHNNGNHQPTSISLVSNGSAIFGAFDNKNDPNFNSFKVGDVSAVPEPVNQALAGLGLLALGATGIKELRRRRKEAARN